ncbi:MAG: hypothetical protein ACRD8O_11115, partial [Bryobacteraceae bacterium]
DTCRLHGGGQPGVTYVSGWEPPPPPAPTPATQAELAMAPKVAPVAAPQPARKSEPDEPVVAQKTEQPRERKGFFRRLWGVFK